MIAGIIHLASSACAEVSATLRMTAVTGDFGGSGCALAIRAAIFLTARGYAIARRMVALVMFGHGSPLLSCKPIIPARPLNDNCVDAWPGGRASQLSGEAGQALGACGGTFDKHPGASLQIAAPNSTHHSAAPVE